VNTKRLNEQQLEEARDLLLGGELVAFPTETVYGLGACLFQEGAIHKIFQVKGRPADNPLIVHIGDLALVEKITKNLPSMFFTLAKRFFPGPLTLLVPKAPCVPSIATGGLASVAIRMPDHPIAQSLLRLVGEPVVAPSANISGRPSATTFEHVLEDFNGKIAAIIEGKSTIGIESTVVSLLDSTPRILRPGTITQETLEECLQCPVPIDSAKEGGGTLSPGTKYRHYAPKARVTLFSSQEEANFYMQSLECRRLILSGTQIQESTNLLWRPLQMESFYAVLREADQRGCVEIAIVCDSLIKAHAGFMNRIEKSAGVS